MSDITVEKKLELMRQIRSRNERDRYDMAHREQVLYGRSGTVSRDEVGPAYNNAAGTEEDEFHTFPLRILLALGLSLLIIVSDMSGKSFLGIRAEQCFSAISTDYESSIAAWVNAASHDISPAVETSAETSEQANP